MICMFFILFSKHNKRKVDKEDSKVCNTKNIHTLTHQNNDNYDNDNYNTTEIMFILIKLNPDIHSKHDTIFLKL